MADDRDPDPDSRMPDHLRQVLIFESTYRLRSGSTKAQQIQDKFGFSAYTYRRLLKEALDHPSAATIAPQAVKNRWTGGTD